MDDLFDRVVGQDLGAKFVQFCGRRIANPIFLKGSHRSYRYLIICDRLLGTLCDRIHHAGFGENIDQLLRAVLGFGKRWVSHRRHDRSLNDAVRQKLVGQQLCLTLFKRSFKQVSPRGPDP